MTLIKMITVNPSIFHIFMAKKKRDKSGFEDKSGCHKSEYALYLVCTSSRKSLFNELSVFSFFSN